MKCKVKWCLVIFYLNYCCISAKDIVNGQLLVDGNSVAGGGGGGGQHEHRFYEEQGATFLCRKTGGTGVGLMLQTKRLTGNQTIEQTMSTGHHPTTSVSMFATLTAAHDGAILTCYSQDPGNPLYLKLKLVLVKSKQGLLSFEVNGALLHRSEENTFSNNIYSYRYQYTYYEDEELHLKIVNDDTGFLFLGCEMRMIRANTSYLETETDEEEITSQKKMETSHELILKKTQSGTSVMCVRQLKATNIFFITEVIFIHRTFDENLPSYYLSKSNILYQYEKTNETNLIVYEIGNKTLQLSCECYDGNNYSLSRTSICSTQTASNYSNFHLESGSNSTTVICLNAAPIITLKLIRSRDQALINDYSVTHPSERTTPKTDPNEITTIRTHSVPTVSSELPNNESTTYETSHHFENKPEGFEHSVDESNHSILMWIVIPVIVALVSLAVTGYFVCRCRRNKLIRSEPLVEPIYEEMRVPPTTCNKTLSTEDNQSTSPAPARNLTDSAKIISNASTQLKDKSSEDPYDVAYDFSPQNSGKSNASPYDVAYDFCPQKSGKSNENPYDVAYHVSPRKSDKPNENIYDVAHNFPPQKSECVSERTYDVIYEARIKRHGTADIPERMRWQRNKDN